jgi:hypothetical protein
VRQLEKSFRRMKGSGSGRMVSCEEMEAAMEVSRPFSPWNRPILTEIYLCDACSCQEIY